jgi:diguanylate cyclase (GGDEF)-like protein
VSKRLSTSKRIFLAVSVFILIIDSLFVVLNAFFAREALQQHFVSWGIDRRATYDILRDQTLDTMQVLAEIFSRDPQLHALFIEGRDAVIREGGGPGGEDAAIFRTALLERLQPAWTVARRDFELRQLHFHIGPGSLSFLRVHQPDRYGDRMDNLRYIIVDAIADGQRRSGFELGRIYSGLRGVVPIFPTIGQNTEMAVGALEVGTSYQPLLETLERRTGSDFAVLLKTDRVDRAMWDQFRHDLVALERDDLVVEATTSKCIAQVINEVPSNLFEDRSQDQLRTAHFQRADGRWIVVVTWPLEDYLSRTRAQVGAPGVVAACDDVTDEMDAYQRSLATSILYAIVAFLALEMVLYFAIRHGTRHLQQRVEAATQSVRDLNSALKVRAETDSLTGLLNRTTFFAIAEETRRRVQQQAEQLSVAMIDIDHFKRINDHYGHVIGDQVIRAIAQTLRAAVRDGDLVCRYGGEEFLLLLQHPAARDEALEASGTPEAVATRIHAAVSALQIPIDHPDVEIRVTVSVGITEMHGDEALECAINRADGLLYAAKRGGRNRVMRG